MENNEDRVLIFSINKFTICSLYTLTKTKIYIFSQVFTELCTAAGIWLCCYPTAILQLYSKNHAQLMAKMNKENTKFINKSITFYGLIFLSSRERCPRGGIWLCWLNPVGRR